MIQADVRRTDRELVVNGRFLSQRATGVQRVQGEFVRALDRLLAAGSFPGLAVRLVVPADADAAHLGLRYVVVEVAPGKGGHGWEQRVLPRYVRGGALLCLGNSAPLCSLFGKGQVGVMLHDQAFLLFPEDYSLAYRLIHRVLDAAILRHARPLFTVSHTEKGVIARGNPHMRAPIVVAANGSWIDDAPPPSTPIETMRREVLYVGSFTTRKNIEAVFRVARSLAESHDITFRFVGPSSPLADAFRAGLPSALAERLIFSGYVDNDDLQRLYRTATCLFYPSLYEASGLPPSEAMTLRCPVIVSDLPVLRERCGTAALYCDPHDDASMRDALLSVVENPALADRLRDRGAEQAAGFTWGGQARVIVEAMLASAG